MPGWGQKDTTSMEQYVSVDRRLIKIETDLTNISVSVNDIKRSMQEAERDLKHSEENWRKSVTTISDEFSKKLEAITHTFAETTKEFVKKSEYQTLKVAVISIVIAVFGQILAKFLLDH
jgi:hypothetical protein